MFVSFVIYTKRWIIAVIILLSLIHIFANKILVSSGSGIMTITDKYMEQFNTLLLNYYNTGESEELKQFLYKNAIQGIRL